MSRWFAVCFLGCLLVGFGWESRAYAHPVDSATLTLRALDASRFEITFQAGSPSLAGLESPAVFPPQCRREGVLLDCGPDGLQGEVQFPWLEGALTRLLLVIEWPDGSRLLRVVPPSKPSVRVYGAPGDGWSALRLVTSDYVWLGIEHILTGFDHLCFVVALTLLVKRPRALLLTVSAFTVAHSFTLAATVLDWVSLPVAPIEVMIAASIVLICGECLRPSASLTSRAPWLMAFAFGLLHGLGFATALLDVGLPEQHVPSALLSFNVGVELGQLGVVAASLLLGWLASFSNTWRESLATVVIYAMGGTAAFWSFERLWGMLVG